MVKAIVKWGKESYDVEVDAASAASDFKLQLFSLTGSFEFPWRTICAAFRSWIQDNSRPTLPLAVR